MASEVSVAGLQEAEALDKQKPWIGLMSVSFGHYTDSQQQEDTEVVEGGTLGVLVAVLLPPISSDCIPLDHHLGWSATQHINKKGSYNTLKLLT